MTMRPAEPFTDAGDAIIDLQAKRAEREAHDAARGLVDNIRPLDSAEKSRDAAETAPEVVQEQYAAAGPTAPEQSAPRTTEPERAAEGVREWQAHNLKSSEPEIREWTAHSFDSGDQPGHAAEPATSFGSR